MFCRGHIFGTSSSTKTTVPIDLKLCEHDEPNRTCILPKCSIFAIPRNETTMNKSRVNQILKTDPKVIIDIQKGYNKLQGFG